MKSCCKILLEELGYSTDLGQTISIPLSDGEIFEFTLSGIINVEMGDIGSYMGMVSKEYANQQMVDQPRLITI